MNTTKSLKLSGNALKVLQSRYLLHQHGLEETPEQLFRRVAKAAASAELKWGTNQDAARWENDFFKIIANLLFLPNSPTLMNAGTPLNQLSACFVLPVEDSLDQIFTSLKHAAIIQQSGGGTGFNFSHLRPKDDPLTITQGTASGPVSFMKVFNAATENIRHGGKRRGANMGILNIDHPDIEAFIESKKETNNLSNFNISVGVSDAYMNAVELNKEWSLVHPNTKQVVRRISAKKLWRNIVANAWQTGDPGLVFLDTINSANPTPALGKIESTNPCGEVPLLPYEPCNLGSVNLSKFVKINKGCSELDWKGLEEVVKIAVRFLDNVVEVNNYIIPEIKALALGNRKIGLGVMGWAELLILLEISYDSEQAVRLAEQLMHFVQEKSMEASVALADERGVFPNWEKSIYYPVTPIRNATRTSIAPTGTISIIAGTCSSIEPLFALAFRRQHVLNEESLFSLNQLFITYLKKHHLHSKEIIDEVKKQGVAGRIEALPAGVKNIFKTALEISPEWHLKHQLAFQKFTDNAVSKTINLAETATIKEVADVYKTAWVQKAKGITIFRYNSKDKQVMYQGIRSGSKACKVCIE
ncbi:adenosylcobalamin-dependent ribonucleoside-diphosphate reductase [Ferruginibacter paludis]|uniref:adenosylcobalamin-dependent ribonucleoside-diphosphate reductase n=1 Tax=Ferruginibacter paludis TaxID=1310417 RepID=UPI0025B4EBB0|nr:adenosylcobalamin-dependent ribonucleoside-diphosphate reductase [Ferruginibacter paludis]MDN3656596.1 adenosylcobalamin-dependent ribonucleoside-diphosphate reductase [Ferruginibacter paludis]